MAGAASRHQRPTGSADALGLGRRGHERRALGCSRRALDCPRRLYARAGAIQPRAIPRGHTVTRQLVRTGIATTQRNLFGYRWSLHKGPRQIEADTLEVGWHPRLWLWGGTNASAPEVMRGLVDGDELTAAFAHRARADGRPNSAQFITLDLGVPVPVDSIVFFPPQPG